VSSVIETRERNVQIMIVAGARPNFIKIAPLMRAFRNRGVAPFLVHTGQHYSKDMSDMFFEQLSIPTPDVNLEVGSGSHVWQIAETMRRLEEVIVSSRPDVTVVVGDVNGTAAAAITSVKLGVPVAHVEAGLRSFDRSMPEETNRILTDSISDWLFTSEPSGAENLLREGIDPKRIHFVGNVMIDSLVTHREKARQRQFPRELGLEPNQYVVMTAHRPSNVDDRDHLESILRAARDIGERMPVIFPIHPRTRKRIEEFGLNSLLSGGLRLIDPVGYLEMLGLIEQARFIMTDSGGMQEESAALQVPCLTLRENTERPVTIDVGANQLVGWEHAAVTAAAQGLLDKTRPTIEAPEKWDGKASDRIAEILLNELRAN